MKGYSESDIFTQSEIELMLSATRIVALLPAEDPDGELIRCHELVRVVGRLLGLEFADGKYGFVDHSWLWATKPELEFMPDVRPWMLPNILDVYVPGGLPQVQLFASGSSALPSCYRHGPARTDIRDSVVKWMLWQLREHGYGEKP